MSAVMSPPAGSPAIGVARVPKRRRSVAPLVATRLRVLIADGDPLARRVVRDALQANVGIVVPAEAKTGVEAVELALHYRPEIVLMEAYFPGEDGIAVAEQIKSAAPDVQVVFLTSLDTLSVALRALRAGASGVLSKQTSIEAVAGALRGVSQGEAAISRSLTMALISHLRDSTAVGSGMRPVRSPLTTREWEVLDLMTTGATTREITDALVLSADTVCSHVKSILRKFGVHTRDEAIAVADQLRHPGLS